MLGSSLGAADGIELGLDDGIELGSSDGPFDGLLGSSGDAFEGTFTTSKFPLVSLSGIIFSLINIIYAVLSSSVSLHPLLISSQCEI